MEKRVHYYIFDVYYPICQCSIIILFSNLAVTCFVVVAVSYYWSSITILVYVSDVILQLVFLLIIIITTLVLATRTVFKK